MKIFLIVFAFVICSSGFAESKESGKKYDEKLLIKSCLDAVDITSDEYVKGEDGSHYMFKSNLDGLGLDTKAQTGFFKLKGKSMQFCELNFPKKSVFEFEHDGVKITKKHSQAGDKASQKLAGPTKCVDAAEAGNYVFSNQIYGFISRSAVQSDLSKAQLKKNLSKCMALRRSEEKLNEGISIRSPKKQENNGAGDSGSNAEQKE